MSPNIADLMSVPAPPQGDDDFAPVELDGDTLLAAFNEKIAEHRERMGSVQSSGVPLEPVVEEPEPEPVEGDEPPESAPAPEPDPPLDRAPLPAPAAEVPTAPVAPAPVQASVPPPVVAPVEVAELPPLPDEFMPGTAEATLWTQQQQILANQEADRKYREAVAQSEHTHQAQNQTVAAVTRAGDRFAARWAGRIDATDLQILARTAGERQLVPALAQSYATAEGREAPTAADFERATEQALEVTLLSDETLRAKVLNPVVAPPTSGTTTRTEADQTRQAKATALASPASPAAPTPTRPTLEARADGKFTPDSKSLLIQDFAKAWRRETQGGS